MISDLRKLEICKAPPLVKPVALFAFKLRLVEPKVDADGPRQRAWVKWRSIVEQDLLVSTTGTLIAGMCENLDSESDTAGTHKDVFEKRIHSNIIQAGTVDLQILEWTKDSSGYRPLLSREVDVYNCLKF